MKIERKSRLVAWYPDWKNEGSLYKFGKPLIPSYSEESETSKTISNNTRSKEDLETLELFWPKWMAKLLMS